MQAAGAVLIELALCLAVTLLAMSAMYVVCGGLFCELRQRVARGGDEPDR